TALIGIASGIAFGMIPALQIAGSANMESLKEGGRFATATRRQLRLRSVLVVFETALALTLLVGAGLFMRSLENLQRVDTGFAAQRVMTGMVALPAPLYRESEKQWAFERTLLARLADEPGVTHAALGLPIPFVGDSGQAFVIEGVA